MRKILFLAALALAAAGRDHPALAGEEMLIFPPADWQRLPMLTQQNVTVARMLPPGATPQHYDEAINVERYDGFSNPPKDFALSAVQEVRKNCEGVQVSPVDETPINNYPAAALRVACTRGRHTGRSGLMMVIAVAGKHALYVAKRIWFGPPVAANQAVLVPQDTLAAWDAFAATVTLCDPDDSTHPCPSANRQR
ncbi:MAG: hypothetical protein M0006_04735 [Magnetospirillum sp.]|nr:hypothetical protein [Magnetospirillum sp.]